MASNGKSWPVKLRERCEAVGWTVTLSKSGHYKVRTSSGVGFTFPSTPGDRRGELNALAQARRQGLEVLEHQLSLTNEHERLLRIKRDRASVGDALISAIVKAEDDEEKRMARKTIAKSDGALGHVNGVAIAESTQAKITTPLTIKHGRGAVPLADSEELLLENGEVVYRCIKPAATPRTPDVKGVCHRTFGSVESLRAHMTFHSRKVLPVTPNARKKSEREAVAAAATAAAAAVATAQASSHGPGVISRVLALTDQFDRFQSELKIMAKSADELAAELADIARALPDHVADEALIEKAKKFDELRKQFG